MPERITLYKTPDGWMARTDNPEVKRLFGTDVLPTAFTAHADAEMVQREIQRLNPDAIVSVRMPA